MISKKIVRIFIVLTTFIIGLVISSNNFYIKNGILYLSLLLLILFFVKPIKFLKISLTYIHMFVIIKLL